MSKHTVRTMEYLRGIGYEVGITERWNSFAGTHGKRIDLFGIIDMVAMGKGSILGVQSCGSDFAEHNRTILNNEYSRKWLINYGGLMLIGWRKLKVKHGGKAMRWVPRIKHYKLSEFEEKIYEENQDGKLEITSK